MLDRKDVLISNYFIAESLSNGEKFGDEIYDNNFYNDEDLRVETVITSVDTDLAYLPKNIYSEILKETNEKSKREKMNFLLGLNVFKNNDKNNNLRNFTNYFKQKICKYKEILYYENAPYENNHFIYFIQNGEFETKLSEVQYIYVKYKDNPVFYFNLSHGINSYNKTKYAEKKFILQIKRPSSHYNIEKKKKKDKDYLETNIINNKTQLSEMKNSSSKVSRKKYSYNIDLILRDEETANSSKHHHLNTFSMNTESNFNFEPKKD